MSDARFARTELLLGSEVVKRLADSHVVVVGLGAVGSYAVEGLARGGVGHLTLVDFDVICESNINRQLYALESTVGSAKASVAAERVRDINPRCVVETLEVFVDENTLDRLLADPPDLVVDAIDTLSSKAMLIRETVRRGIPVVSSMGAALRLDPTAVRVGPLSRTEACPLARRLRRMLRDQIDTDRVLCVYSAEAVRKGLAGESDATENTDAASGSEGRRRALPSLPTVTGVFGLTVASEGLRLLLGGRWPDPSTGAT